MLSDAEEIETLTAERDYWKAEAQHNVRTDVAARIAKGFGLTPAEAWIVAMLYAANGKTVRRTRLSEDIPGCNWEERSDNSNIVEVFISKARKKIGRDSIETIRALGYRLSPAMAARIDAVLA